MASRNRSRWPAWRAVSSIMCTKIHRRLTGPFPNEGTAATTSRESKRIGCGATARTGAGVERQHLVDRVVPAGVERPVGVLSQGSGRPRFRQLQPEQLALEPAIFGPCQVLHDPADGGVGDREYMRRRARLVEVGQLARHDVPVLVEELLQGGAFVRWAEAPETSSGDRSSRQPATRAVTPTRRRPPRGWRRACGGSRRARRGPGPAARRTQRNQPGRGRS
jgi:hypothetical protein